MLEGLNNYASVDFIDFDLVKLYESLHPSHGLFASHLFEVLFKILILRYIIDSP